MSVSGDSGQVRVNIEAARPGVVHGHGGAEAHRLRAELEELTGKPVLLNMLQEPGPPGTTTHSQPIQLHDVKSIRPAAPAGGRLHGCTAARRPRWGPAGQRGAGHPGTTGGSAAAGT